MQQQVTVMARGKWTGCITRSVSAPARSVSTTTAPVHRRCVGAPPHRVVVTGIGLVTPLGIGQSEVYQTLMRGQSATRAIPKSHDAPTAFDDPALRAVSLLDLPSQVCAPLPSDALRDACQAHVPRTLLSQCSRFIQLALLASSLALQDARYQAVTPEAQARSGVCIGTGLGSVHDINESSLLLHEKGRRSLSAYAIPKMLLNLAAGQVSIAHAFRGPQHCASTACAAGAHSIGDAARYLAQGEASVMLAGSSEAPINPLSMALFTRMRALSTKHNGTPHSASRPFSKSRDGFVMGEGAGVVVLETLEHALARDAPHIYAELIGYGCSADAHHITTPAPDGRGAHASMQQALFSCRDMIDAEQIDYINAHATSTLMGDAAENLAIKSLFGSHAYKLSVSSSKSAIGHLLGASGSVEAIFAALACHTQSVPPTCSVKEEDLDRAEFDLDYVLGQGRSRKVRASMSNSFGFGGTNATLIFQRYAS